KGPAVLLQAATAGEHRLRRIHGIWGLWQLGRKKVDAARPLVALLNDNDPEIRAQAAKVLGDVSFRAAANDVAELLKDPEPRVRSIAGMAMRRLADDSHVADAVALLEANTANDVFVRHGGVMTLAGVGRDTPEAVVALAAHGSVPVRLAAVVALRKLKHPGVARFLGDADPLVVSEAARAIYDDLSIPEALPALGRLLARRPFDDEPSLRRAIHANLRLGDADAARRLVDYAASPGAPEMWRVEALNALSQWNRKLELDAVQGFYRGTGPHDTALVVAALDRVIGALTVDPSPAIQAAASKLFSKIQYSGAEERITALALDEDKDWSVRASALEAMEALKAPGYDEAVDAAFRSSSESLRVAALKLLGQTQPGAERTRAYIEERVEAGTLREQQLAWQLLKKAPRQALLMKGFEQLKKGQLNKELRLDVYETLRANPILSDRVGELKLDRYALALHGGRAEEGETVFKTSPLRETSTGGLE
ncbi:MAG: HEAT repeat domain-containing protein, partial [Verrucomicrobiota bacterium]